MSRENVIQYAKQIKMYADSHQKETAIDLFEKLTDMFSNINDYQTDDREKKLRQVRSAIYKGSSREEEYKVDVDLMTCPPEVFKIHILKDLFLGAPFLRDFPPFSKFILNDKEVRNLLIESIST